MQIDNIGVFLVTLFASNDLTMKVALWSMFICTQYVLRVSIHDFLMLKEIRKSYVLSYWKQPDLIFRFTLAFLTFYYALFKYLKFDIALSVTCVLFLISCFIKYIKQVQHRQIGWMHKRLLSIKIRTAKLKI